jgi:hypothetical protein
MGVEGGPEPAEERRDVRVGRVVVQDLAGVPLEGAVIDDRQDAERAVITPLSRNPTGRFRNYGATISSNRCCPASPEYAAYGKDRYMLL